ncbi:MAG TPA: SRPBCC domain-containing protein, partial [Candidatus Paceibacterota bacterium]
QDNHLIEGLTTITFEDMGAKTKMTVHVTATGVTPAAQKMLEGMDQGWNEQLDKLGAFVR